LRAEAEARRRIIEGRGFVADQLEGIAEIMTGLAKEMHRDVEFRLEVEERLKSSFNRFGLAVESVNVFDYGRHMLEVRVKKHGCLNYFECQYLITPMLSRLLGYTFTVWEKQCPRAGSHDCCFTLVPAGKYRVKHAVATMAKDPGHSGDSYTMLKTKDGRFAIILSDGMGTGPRAARESRATVDLLAQLISSGFKEEFTLNLINSVLMLRTPEERFATVDLALLDLFRGELEMIKIGAAPSYIKRHREVVSIKAATPPAGILQELPIERQRYTLSLGDYLILTTDGVFAGELGPAETEDWVERALARVEVSGPQPMADFLLQLVQANMGTEARDDVTIIAAQILPADLCVSFRPR
ncbi:MAG: SpoIIE family protein phosphatase, partial [Firmicutes bacterium]|nr:SpoIIE family protein phosphatase [Bacillota bacterium]